MLPGEIQFEFQAEFQIDRYELLFQVPRESEMSPRKQNIKTELGYGS